MYSTTDDLPKYLSANIGLIQTKIEDEMYETRLTRHPFGQSSYNKLLTDYIGLGWTVTTDFGTKVISHTGSIDGYTSIIGFNPSTQIGLVILCGCDHSDFTTRNDKSCDSFSSLLQITKSIYIFLFLTKSI